MIMQRSHALDVYAIDYEALALRSVILKYSNLNDYGRGAREIRRRQGSCDTKFEYRLALALYDDLKKLR